MDYDELDRLLRKLSEEGEEEKVKRRLKKKKKKVCPPSLEGRRDVVVLKADEIKSKNAHWRIEIFQPQTSERKGLFLSKNEGEFCVMISAGIPDDLKMDHIFENEKIPGYVKKTLVKKGYVDEILT